MDETQKSQDVVEPEIPHEALIDDLGSSGSGGLGLSESKQVSSSLKDVSDLTVVRYDQMAKAASAGLMAHKDVEAAIVEISGTPGELVFHLTCAFVDDVDPSAVMELISHGVITNVERLLGETFASRDLQFAFAPTDSTAP